MKAYRERIKKYIIANGVIACMIYNRVIWRIELEKPITK